MREARYIYRAPVLHAFFRRTTYQTVRMGVVSATVPSGHKVDVTSIERTLIDITVRPGYAGDDKAADDSRIDVKPGTTLGRRLDLESRDSATYGSGKFLDGNRF